MVLPLPQRIFLVPKILKDMSVAKGRLGGYFGRMGELFFFSCINEMVLEVT